MPTELTQVVQENAGYIITGLGGVALLLVAKKTRQAIGAGLMLGSILMGKLALKLGAEPPKDPK